MNFNFDFSTGKSPFSSLGTPFSGINGEEHEKFSNNIGFGNFSFKNVNSQDPNDNSKIVNNSTTEQNNKPNIANSQQNQEVNLQSQSTGDASKLPQMQSSTTPSASSPISLPTTDKISLNDNKSNNNPPKFEFKWNPTISENFNSMMNKKLNKFGTNKRSANSKKLNGRHKLFDNDDNFTFDHDDEPLSQSESEDEYDRKGDKIDHVVKKSVERIFEESASFAQKKRLQKSIAKIVHDFADRLGESEDSEYDDGYYDDEYDDEEEGQFQGQIPQINLVFGAPPPNYMMPPPNLFMSPFQPPLPPPQLLQQQQQMMMMNQGQPPQFDMFPNQLQQQQMMMMMNQGQPLQPFGMFPNQQQQQQMMMMMNQGQQQQAWQTPMKSPMKMKARGGLKQDSKVTVKEFNKLSLQLQQSVVSDLMTLGEDRRGLASLHSLILYILAFKGVSYGSSYLALSTEKQDKPLSDRSVSLGGVYLFFSTTSVLHDDKQLSSPMFQSLASQFDELFIEVKYPSKKFDSQFSTVKKLHNKNPSKVKLAVFFSSSFEDNKKLVGNKDINAVRIDPSLKKFCFADYVSLTHVVLPPSLLEIPNNAFERCSALKHVFVPDSVTKIGSKAFGGCSALKSIKLPMAITAIGSGGFNGCSALTSINLPSSLESIKSALFEKCSSLKSVVIPSSVTVIGLLAFKDCSALSELTIPSSVKEVRESAFEGCEALKKVELSSGVSTISPRSFKKCTSLKSVVFPDSVTDIKESAFENCTSLEKVVFPSSIQRINSLAFAGCSALKEVELDDPSVARANAFCSSTTIAKKISQKGSVSDAMSKDVDVFANVEQKPIELQVKEESNASNGAGQGMSTGNITVQSRRSIYSSKKKTGNKWGNTFSATPSNMPTSQSSSSGTWEVNKAPGNLSSNWGSVSFDQPPSVWGRNTPSQGPSVWDIDTPSQHPRHSNPFDQPPQSDNTSGQRPQPDQCLIF